MNTEGFDRVFLAVDLYLWPEAMHKGFMVPMDFEGAFNGKFNTVGPFVFAD